MARCVRCHRVLKTEEAKKAGYGATCFKKLFGKPLPTEKSPRRLIGTDKKEPQTKRRRPVRPIPLYAKDFVCSLDAGGNPVTNVPRRIVYHSPTGFSWGYGGSGPADLVLNILSLYVEEDEAYELHQEFKRFFIEPMPKEGGTIPRDAIVEWLKQRRKQDE